MHVHRDVTNSETPIRGLTTVMGGGRIVRLYPGGLAWMEPSEIGKSGIQLSSVLGAFIFAKPRTSIRDKARVTSQRSHRPGLSLED
jgi:hypothetical protein